MGEVFAQVGRVGGCAVDQGRLAAAQKWHPHQVQAGAGGDAAVVADMAFSVEHLDVEPRQIRAKSGGPQDRSDGAGA